METVSNTLLKPTSPHEEGKKNEELGTQEFSPHLCNKVVWTRKKFWGIVGILFILHLSVLFAVIYYQIKPGLFLLLDVMNKHSPKNLAIQEIIVQGIPLRLFQPPQYDKIVIVLSGIHYDGYNEPRLLEFVKNLAGHQILVITPDLYDLKNYNLSTQAISDLVTVTEWVLNESKLLQKHTLLGYMGFSFAGGLSLAAAGHPKLKGHIDFVISFGGPAHVDTTLEALTTGHFTDDPTEYRKPDPYALVTMLLQYLEFCCPSEDYASVKEGMLEFFHYRGGVPEHIRHRVSQESQKFLDLCFSGNSTEQGKILSKVLGRKKMPAQLSPLENPSPQSCLFFIHGVYDDVIPPRESIRLASWSNTPPSRVLISPLIGHVDLTAHISYRDMFRLASFFSDLLRLGPKYAK